MREYFIKIKEIKTGKTKSIVKSYSDSMVKNWKIGQIIQGFELIEFYPTNYTIKPSMFY